MSFPLEDKVFIGMSILSVEECLAFTTQKYHQALMSKSIYDLEGLYNLVERYHSAISHFFTVFCPLHKITENDVEIFKYEYKKISVNERSKLISKRKLSELDIFGMYLTH